MRSGKQAELLNDLLESAAAKEGFDGRRLRELVGHTWAEVLGGFVFGILFFYVWRL